MKDNRLLVVGILIISIVSWCGDAFAQTTPITNYPCDKRSTANGGTCPAACVFVATQEKGCNCFDSADNDGDGKKDASDPDCATYFGLAFSGSGSNCSITPPAGTTAWTGVGAPATSSQNTADTQSKVAVGDIDNDGTPDAVITSKWNSKVRVIATTSGQCGKVKPGDAKAEYDLSGKKKDFEGLGCGSVDRLLFEHEIMIADIDRDGDGEIFTIASNRSGNPESPPTCFFLVAFTPHYKTGCMDALDRMYITYLGTNRPGSFGISDFDGDGKSEIYMRDRIFAAENGKLLASEGAKAMTNTARWDVDVAGGPVAVDFDKDGTLDLIVGAQIYKTPDLKTNRSPGAPAALIAHKNMNALTFDINKDLVNDQYFVKLMTDPDEYGTDTHSSGSVADINEDGFLDVVITGAITSATGRTSIFYWDVHNDKVRGFCTPKSSELGISPADDTTYTNYLNGWIWGTGRVNLGDANGDGKMDLSLIAGSQLFCLTTNGSGDLISLWTQNAVNVPSSTGPLALGYRQINDSRSGVLTVTIYDFDNDGKPEMVYRDSQEIVVVDGATGTVKIWSAICQSHTYTEGPVIADFNGDGATDIGAACFTSTSFKVNAGIQQQALGQIRMWYSNDNTWLPTRAVWNQPGYFVVNVNDDLTVPYPQFDQMFSFGNTPCPNGIPGPNQPMNVFMNQVPILSANGCPVFPAPDLAYVGDPPTAACNANPTGPGCDADGSGSYNPAVVVIPPICGNLTIQVYFNIINSGDLPITDLVPVSFFNGDPTVSPVTATKLTASAPSVQITNLGVGATLKTPTITLTGPGSTFELYIVLYNDGTSLPINLALGSAKECSIGNNMYHVTITPDPISATVEKLADNYKCINSAPNNGSLKVHLFKGATEVTTLTGYSFQWYSGIGTGTPMAGKTTPTITGLAEGDYTVVVTDIAKGCTSLPISMNVARLGNDPTIMFKTPIHQSKCNPADGKLEAYIVEGNTGFTFEWFDIALTPLGISGVGATIANGLVGPNSYVVRVTKDGCTKTSDPITVNGPPVPDVQASVLQHVVDCSNPNSGIITADAFKGGVLQPAAGYTFSWYYYNAANSPPGGSILPGAHGTGNTRTALPVGGYYVKVLENATGCFSLQTPNVAVTSQTVIPSAPLITQVTPQTSCDPAQPNGALTATATIGGAPQNPAGFTFEWFKGLTTLPADKVPAANVSDVNGRQVNKVAGGGIPYTVKVTTPQNCFATANFVIAENKIVPVVTLAQLTPNSICDPANATSGYNGSVRATVTFGPSTITLPDPNYTFAWYDGTTTGTPHVPAPADNKARDLTSLVDGNYTVVVTRTDLFCVSAPDTEPVAKTSINPVLSALSTGSNNCSAALTPDGTVTVSVTNTGASPGPFTYQWYDGNVAGVNPLGAANNGTTATVIKVGGPTGAPRPYTVKVLNTATGCVNNTTQSVSDVSVTPVLSTTTQPNAVCSPATNFGGSMTVSVTNIPALYTIADYTFVWYNGATTAVQHNPQPSPNTSVTMPKLDVGSYSVVGTNTKTGCVSAISTNAVANTKKIPTLTPSSTGSNNCDATLAPDGTVTVAATVAVGPFNYQWYKGSGDPIAGSLPVVPTAVNNGQSVTAIGLGGPVAAPTSYTVLVTDQITGCNNFVTTAVADVSIIPVLSTATTPNSVCSPAANRNGTMTVSVTNIPALYTIADYTFEWYNGATTTTLHSPQPVGVTMPTLNNGSFTVVGTNTKTGCVSVKATNTVANAKVFPTLTPSSTGSNNCIVDVPNGINNDGTATVTVNTPALPAASFAFQWYVGTGDPIAGGFPTVPAANNGTAATATGLGGPTGPISYTALVTIVGTGCTNYSTATVADNSTLPVLSTSTQPNSICSPSTSFNGSMTVGVTNIPAGYVIGDYTFKWFDGATTVTQHNPQPAPTTTLTLPKLDVASYTVVGTNSKTGCVSVKATNAVANGKVFPTLSPSSTGSNNCVNNPGAGINPDGTTTVTVTAPALPPASFTYQWYVGSGDPIAGGFTTVPVANNGQAATATGLGGPVGAPISYTALVTIAGTGCTNYSTAVVADNSSLPVLSTSTQPNTICSPATSFNGSMTVGVTNIPAGYVIGDYTFTWFDGTTTATQHNPQPSPTTTLTLPKLDVASYTVVGTNTKTGCVSVKATNAVANGKAFPVIAATSTGSHNCSASVAADGTATVTVTAPAASSFTYQWYVGAIDPAVGSPTVVPGGSGAIAATGGTGVVNGVGGPTGAPNSYTVLVTRTGTGCSAYTAASVADISQKPTFTITPSPNTVCSITISGGPTTFNGHVDVTAPIGPTYTYQWFDVGGGGALTLRPANTAAILPQVGSGEYAATITIPATGCISDPQSAEVLDAPATITVTTSVTASTNCTGSGNGNAIVTAPVGANFSYQWYDGTSITPAKLRAGDTGVDLGNPGNDMQGAAGAAGKFAVLVTNLTDGCTKNKSVTVTDAKVLPDIDLTLTLNNTVCDITVAGGPTKFNGAIASAVTKSGAPLGAGTFTLTWTGTGTQSGTSLIELAAGSYSATATETATGCTSASDAQAIIDVLTFPVIGVTVTPQTSCSATSNGKLVALGDGAASTATHIFLWKDGVGLGGVTRAQSGTGIINQLPSADYTVKVTSKATGCVSTESRFVPSSVTTPSITFNGLTQVSSCTSPNGTATAVIAGLSAPNLYDIYYVYNTTISGSAYPTDPTDVKSTVNPAWTRTLLSNQNAAPAARVNMMPGYLTALVVDKNTQCESTPATQQILDATLDYDIALALIPAPGICGTGGGGITPTVTPPSASYTFEWYAGAPTDASPINFFTNPPDFATAQLYPDNRPNLGISGGDATINPGTFTLVVYDLNGCGEYKTDAVPTESAPVLNIITTPITSCVSSNGAIDVEVLSGTSAAGYSLELFKGNDETGVSQGSIGVSPVGTNLAKAGLAEGAYFIKVVDGDTPLCPIGVGQPLAKVVLPPVITLDQIDPNTSCDPANDADGKVTLSVNNANGDTQGKDYEVKSIVPPVTGFANGTQIGTGASGQQIGPIIGFKPPTTLAPDYTITVMDFISKCESDVVITIPNVNTSLDVLVVNAFAETICANSGGLSVGKAVASFSGGESTTHYDFTWAKASDLSLPVYGPVTGDGAGGGGDLLNRAHATAANWPMGTVGQGTGNRTFYVRAEIIDWDPTVAVAPGVGCKTPVLQVVIPDQHVSPKMTLTPKFDSFCLATAVNTQLGDGQIVIAADAVPSVAGNQNSTGGFNYSWTNANSASGGMVSPQLAQSNNFTIPQLGDGAFSVTATNVDNQCRVVKSSTINPAPFDINVNTHTLVDQRICLPDGNITLTQITVDRSADPAAGGNIVQGPGAILDTEYDFLWYKADPTNPGTFNPALGQELDDNLTNPIVISTLGIDRDLVAEATEYQAMGAGTYYVVATRSNPASVGFGCPAQPYRVDVADSHKNPVPSLTAISNTSCLPAGPGEGEILINVTDATADATVPFPPVTGFTYTYTFPGPGPIPAPFLPLGATNNIPGTGNGNGSSADADDDHYKVLLDNALPYKVHILNNQTGCSADATATIVKNATPVFVQNVTVVDEVLCSATGDGSITVTKVSMNDRTGANLDFVAAPTGLQGAISDFNFQWKRAASGTLTTAGTILDNTTYAAPLPGVIGAGTYTVIAKRNVGTPGAGCPSAPFTVTILNKKVNPVVELTPFSNTSCSTNGALQEGEITIKVSDNSTAPVPAVPGFTYTWGANPTVIPAAAFPAPNDGDGFGNGDTDLTPAVDNDEDHAFGLKEGAYSMTVRSNKSGCTTNASTTILKNALPVFIQNITTLDQVICGPDGSLTVTSITVNKADGTVLVSGPDFNITDFEFDWSRNAAAGTQTTAGTILDIGTYLPASFGGTPLGFDTYTVVGRRISGGPGLDCVSTPFDASILDKRVFPVAALTPFSNTSCSANPALQEGEMKVKVTDATTVAPPAGGFRYDYTWTVAATAIAPSVGNDGDETTDAGTDKDLEIALGDGAYTVQVVNPTTQCSTTASGTITKNALPIFLQGITAVDQVICGPDGSLTVASIIVQKADGTTEVSGPDFPLTNFEFDWSRNGAAGTQTTPGAILDAGTYLPASFGGTPLGFDTYTVLARRIAGGPGVGCPSTPVDADILDKRIFPVVTLTPFANTSCSSLPTDLEGEITVEVVDNPALTGPYTYTYTWSGTNPTAIASAAFPAPNDGDGFGGGETEVPPPTVDNDEDHPTALAEGIYNMTVRSNVSGCTVNGQTEIFKNSTPVFTQLVIPTDAVLCTADGKLVVNEVQVIDRNGQIQSSLTDFSIGDFDFNYSRTTLGNLVPSVATPVTATQLDITNYPAIGADVYFVVATRRLNGPGLGCSSPEYKVDILDKHINPVVSLTPFANTSCDPAFFEGEVEVRVTDNSINLPAPLAPPFTYSYDWTFSSTPLVINGPVAGVHDGDGLGNGDPDGAGFDNDGDHPGSLMDGPYTIAVTNAQTGCVGNGAVTIFKNSTPVFTQLVIPTHQVMCNPDGMLVVNEVQVIDRDGNVQSNLTLDFPLSDFAFRYDRGPSRTTVVDPAIPLPFAPQPVTQLDNITYPAIGFDEYYVYATRVAGGPGLDCLSAPYKVDILDQREFPTAAFTSIANSTCNVAKPNGSVIISAEEQDGTTTDPYTFAWTLDGGAINPASTQTDTSPTSTLADAQDGDYVVTVTNTVTGCPFDAGYNLTMDPTRATPNVIDVTTIDPLDCLATASAEVTKITLGSNTNSTLFPPNVPPNNEITGPALLGFTYSWYSGSMSNLIPGVTTPLNNTLVPGTYFVTVLDPTTDCVSGPKELEIVDDLIVYPVVNIVQTAKQISCLGTTGTAALAATGDNQDDTNPDYAFSWHQSLDVSGPVFASTSAISSLTLGDYSVNVTRASTGCSANALFIIPDDSPAFTPQVLISPSARTLCVGTDGAILARVINLDPGYPFPYNYTSDLYNGGTPNLSAPADFPNMPFVTGFITNFIQSPLPDGIYTVRVTDNNTGCFGIVSDTIQDNRVNPIPEILQDNPMTNCDPARPDGQLAASADGGQIVGYTFDWYTGTAIPVPPGALIMSGDKLIGQPAGDYVMRATDDLTGCFADKSQNIQDATIYPPAPNAVVERHRTDCVTPNGWVSVSVQGVVVNYSFDWYDGTAASGGIDFNGIDYLSRDIGPYTVTATDVVTGCVSLPTTVDVEDGRIIPEFNFETHSSYCVDTGLPHGTGSVQLLLKTEGVVLDDIVWYEDATNTQIGTGPAVYELFPGVYRAEVVSTQGCTNQGTAEIGTEISPYNGISKDDDGLNDTFIVDCISNFPDNNVKIFNRNGILVFEADGYDNQTVVFGGSGEKGVYLQGINLPAGTYFYIIDKRDGSKPVAGYLELER